MSTCQIIIFTIWTPVIYIYRPNKCKSTCQTCIMMTVSGKTSFVTNFGFLNLWQLTRGYKEMTSWKKYVTRWRHKSDFNRSGTIAGFSYVAI